MRRHMEGIRVRRLVSFGALVAALVALSAPSASHAQIPLICIGAECRPPAGPAGPAGPEGPAGPAGSFDTGSLYTRRCPGVAECSCDPGDFALGGGGLCAFGDVMVSSECFAEDPLPCTTWRVICLTPAATGTSPTRTSVVCTRP